MQCSSKTVLASAKPIPKKHKRVANENHINQNSIWSKNFVARTVPAISNVKKVCFPTTFSKSSSIDTSSLVRVLPKKVCSTEIESDNGFCVEALSEIYGNKSKDKQVCLNIEIEESQSPSKEYFKTKPDCCDSLEDSLSTPTTPKKVRNPFAKELHSISIQASPEKLYEHNPEITSPIFKMNLSKNTSLVKAITSPTKAIKRKRLSKFSSTSVPEEKIVSRFFKDEDQQMLPRLINAEDEVFHKNSASFDSMHKYSRCRKSLKLERAQSVNLPLFQTTITASQEKQIFKGLVKTLTTSKIDKNSAVLSEYKNPTNKGKHEIDDVISICDAPDKELNSLVGNVDIEESTTLSQPFSNIKMSEKPYQKTQLQESSNFKNDIAKNRVLCRMPGLTKNKKTQNSNTQSRLSMFGFKKRDKISS